LEALLEKAGLRPETRGSAPVAMRFADAATALRGLLAPGPATRAIRHSGEDPVRKGIADAVATYRQSDGSYLLRNEFQYVVSRT
jgi:hypothetical protein